MTIISDSLFIYYMTPAICVLSLSIYIPIKLLLDLIFVFTTLLDNFLLVHTYTYVYVCKKILIHLRE